MGTEVFFIAICDDEEYFCIREKELISKYMDKHNYKYQIDIYLSGKDFISHRENVF